MSWFYKQLSIFRQAPGLLFYVQISGKFIAGIGIGLLLAGCIPVWTWWIFIVASLVMSVPTVVFLCAGRLKNNDQNKQPDQAL